MKSHLEGQFSKYLANLMTKDERASFEKKLVSDDELKNEFEEYQIGMVAGKRIQYLELKDVVGRIVDEEDSKNNNPRKKDAKIIKLNWKKLIRALPAAVIVLFVVSWMLNITKREKLTGENFFASNYEKEEDPITRGLEEDVLYARQFTTEQLTQPYYQRFLGHLYIEKNQIDSAFFAFRKAAFYSVPNSKDKLKAHWYLGLLHTKNEQCDSTIHYLSMIKNSKVKTDLVPTAKKLLSQIKKADFCD